MSHNCVLPNLERRQEFGREVGELSLCIYEHQSFLSHTSYPSPQTLSEAKKRAFDIFIRLFVKPHIILGFEHVDIY